MVIASIIISVFFVGHMLFLWFRFLTKDNNYNQNLEIRGGKKVGIEDGSSTKLLLSNHSDQMDTIVKGMKVPAAPVTSSFAGLSVRLSDINTNQFYDFYLENQIVIGRVGGSAFVQLDDTMVSKKHCMIYRKGEQVFIQDLDSTNHTYLNGCKLESPMQICSGDIIHIGKSTLQFQHTYTNSVK